MAGDKKDIIQTPFHEFHLAAKGKMVEFAGFHMPVQYESGIIAEHLSVRENVGLFDLSHMGELEVSGNDALKFLQRTTTNNVATLTPGKIQYSCMTYPEGGIVDDLLVYMLKDSYMLIVNASNIEKDVAWLESQLEGDVKLVNKSNDLGLLAIQGPQAQSVLAEITDYDLDSMGYYTSARATIGGQEILFSRTGYTGEDGFELYIPTKHCHQLWKAIMEAGSKYDLKLIGLGARDTLRLEMKMALYGNDIDQSTSPIEAGLSWIVSFDKDFIGKMPLMQQKEQKPRRRLVCLQLEGKVFPRPGYEIHDGEEIIGHVTSGTFSPSLKIPIALGYVPISKAKIGSSVEIAIRNKRFEAKVVKPPFYKNASHR